MSPLPKYPNRFYRLRIKLTKTTNRLRHKIFKIRNPNTIPIEIHSDNGFFAQLNWSLQLFAYCESIGRTPSLRLTSELYTKEKNESWLDYFFEQIEITPEQKRRLSRQHSSFLRINHIKELAHIGDKTQGLTLENANRLLRKYLRVNEEISNYVDAYVANNFSTGKTVGIHFRGTDKASEAERVDWKEIAKVLSNYLNAHPETEVLFAASDEQEFIQWIDSQFASKLTIVCHDDQEKSKSGKAIHTNIDEGCKYTKGKEALVNCLILSRCDALIRTASFLSGWASVFNCNLPVTLMNPPFSKTLWFPDREIAKRSVDKHLNR